MMTGLKTLSSKCLAAGEGDCRLVAHHLRAHHGHRLGLGRVDLAGHDREPGSFSGRRSRRGPSAARTPAGGCRWRSSTAGGQLASAPWVNTSASLAASASNLFGAVVNGRAVSSVTSGEASANSGCALRPVPTAVPPCARRKDPAGSPRSRAMRARSAWHSRRIPGPASPAWRPAGGCGRS